MSESCEQCRDSLDRTEEVLDQVWELLYPGTSWMYRDQVARELKAFAEFVPLAWELSRKRIAFLPIAVFHPLFPHVLTLSRNWAMTSGQATWSEDDERKYQDIIEQWNKDFGPTYGVFEARPWMKTA